MKGIGKVNKEVLNKFCIIIIVYSLIFNLSLVTYPKPSHTDIVSIVEEATKSTLVTPIKYNRNIGVGTVLTNKPIVEKKTVVLKNNNTLSRGGEIEYDRTFTLTFYSGLACENSKYGAVTHKGIKLFDGVVANNVLPYQTKIKLDGWGTVEVLDIGGGGFDSPNRLDVYVSRDKGESDSKYYNRVQAMGKIKVKGKIIK